MEHRDMRMIYLASPYNSPDPLVKASRYDAVCRLAGQIMRAHSGLLVFSPIAHSHSILLNRSDFDGGWEYWKNFDLRMIENCDEMWIAKLEGWQKSVGIAAEIEHCKQINKPLYFVEYIYPDVVITSFFNDGVKFILMGQDLTR